MCAVGKWLDPDNPYYSIISKSDYNVVNIDNKYGINSVLKEEAINILNIEEWRGTQSIHDTIANSNNYDIIEPICSLERESKTDLSELKELCKNMS